MTIAMTTMVAVDMPIIDVFRTAIQMKCNYLKPQSFMIDQFGINQLEIFQS